METLRKNEKKMLEVKINVTEMENAFHRLSSRLDTAEERMTGPEDISIQTSRTKVQRKKLIKKIQQNIQELWDNYKTVMGVPGRE